MLVRFGTIIRSFTSIIALTVLIPAMGSGAATADSEQPDGACRIDPANPAVTVDSLRFHCTIRQADALFAASAPGRAPTGRQRLWILPHVHVVGLPVPYSMGSIWATAESVLGDGLTFDNGWVKKDYRPPFAAMSIGGALRSGASDFDHRPAWTVDYPADTLGLPISSHELREISPGVWIGWSYFLQKWNPATGTPVHGSYVITR